MVGWLPCMRTSGACAAPAAPLVPSSSVQKTERAALPASHQKATCFHESFRDSHVHRHASVCQKKGASACYQAQRPTVVIQ